MAIGAAASDRWVIAALLINNNGAQYLASVTIGGVAATLLYSAPAAGTARVRFEYWAAPVPTGTTANVAVTSDGGPIWDGACATYYCAGEPTYFDGEHDATYTGTTFSVAIDVPEGGAVIATASNDGSGVLSGWVGAAADSTDDTEQVYLASADELTAETGRTVSFTSTVASSSTNFYGLAVLSVSIPMTGGGGQTLTATIYSDGDTFGAASITTGAVGLAPTLFADADSFGAAAVTRGAVSLAPTIYADGDTFGAATVGSGAVTLTATLFADGDSFGAAVVTGGEPVAPAGSPGGGGTVAKAPDPIRPNRRAQVRDALEDHLDKAQRVDEPVIDAPKPVKKPKRVAPIAPTLTADTTLGIIRAIEAKVQAAIDADAMAQALAQAEALALELAWIAEDEADLELLLLAM
jgi:hypothetical protein